MDEEDKQDLMAELKFQAFFNISLDFNIHIHGA